MSADKPLVVAKNGSFSIIWYSGSFVSKSTMYQAPNDVSWITVLFFGKYRVWVYEQYYERRLSCQKKNQNVHFCEHLIPLRYNNFSRSGLEQALCFLYHGALIYGASFLDNESHYANFFYKILSIFFLETKDTIVALTQSCRINQFIV
jgi:hypothetical protein